MFARFGTFMYRRRWYVIGLWVLVLFLSVGLASQVGSVLGPGDFTIGGSDSIKASAVLDTKFHQSDARTSLIVLKNLHGTIADMTFQRDVAAVVGKIRADRALRIEYLDDPLQTHNKQLISRDRRAVIILFSSRLPEADIQAQIGRLRTLVHTRGIQSYVTGTPASQEDYAVQAQNDLQKGDSITVPVLLIILLVVFGSIVAAGLPLVLAACSISVSLALVYIFAHYVTSSVYVANVVEVLGLGVSIDYSLFIVSRFREELARSSGDREAAIVQTMQTTGRAVFFSGLTVAIGLSSLFFTGISFTVSLGLGGMLVPLCALLVAMTLLPALLGVLGPRVNFRARHWIMVRTGVRRQEPVRDQTPAYEHSDGGIWQRLALFTMRRPIVTGAIALAILLLLAAPATQLQLAYGGLKNQPKNVESVAGFIYMQSHFPSSPDPTSIVLQPSGSRSVLSRPVQAGIRSLEQALRRDPEVVSVTGPTDYLPAGATPTPGQLKQVIGRFISPDRGTALITVVPRHEVGTSANERMVRRIRILAHGFEAGALNGTNIFVGGAAAGYIDWNDALYSKFPFVIALVLILTYGFLFFAFRSVFLPLKAVLLNLLSVGAAYGVLELVFQQGLAHTQLGFVPEDGIAPWVPVFLFAFLFGLSMDYEVFLISRIRERWLFTGYNRESVAFGLERTGRLITSAALIMVVAFSGFQIGHEIQLREFGFGLMASVAIDATLIRVILVPSIMELMGKWNWWVPDRLRTWQKHGVMEGDTETETLAKPEPAGAS
ncbi:MAG TPA: MMPL family transporter [Chloroflexota bacterium]